MSSVLNQLYFDPATLKWGLHRTDAVPTLPPSKEIVLLCAEVSSSNTEALTRIIEQHHPVFICARNVGRPVYDAICGLNVVRHNYAVCQHSSPMQQNVIFWHLSVGTDYVSLRNGPVVTSTTLSLRQIRGVRCNFTLLCASASTATGNSARGVGELLSDLPISSVSPPTAAVAVLPKGADVKTAASTHDFATVWSLSESPFQISLRGCIAGDSIMGLPAENCNAVIATLSISSALTTAAPAPNSKKPSTSAASWSTDRSIILPSCLSPAELVLDITGLVTSLNDAVDGLNSGRIPWIYDYAVCVGMGKGETFPAFVLVSSQGQCDVIPFRAYLAKIHFSRPTTAPNPALCNRPNQKWTVQSSMPLHSIAPGDVVYDISVVLPASVTPYTLGQIVNKLNANEVDWKKDYAIAFCADGDCYYLLASTNVACDVAAARHEAMKDQTPTAKDK